MIIFGESLILIFFVFLKIKKTINALVLNVLFVLREAEVQKSRNAITLFTRSVRGQEWNSNVRLEDHVPRIFTLNEK